MMGMGWGQRCPQRQVSLLLASAAIRWCGLRPQLVPPGQLPGPGGLLLVPGGWHARSVGDNVVSYKNGPRLERLGQRHRPDRGSP